MNSGALPTRVAVGWLVTRLFLFASAALAVTALPHLSGFTAPYDNLWLDGWHRADAVLYLSIAQDGYQQGFHSNCGWLFLYPLLMKCLPWPPNLLARGLCLSNLMLLAALALWYRWLRLDHDPDRSQRTLLWFLAFPSAFYAAAPLSESSYLLFSLGAFLAARQGRWALAGLAGAAAVSTRFVGLALLPAFLWEARQQRCGWNQTVWLGLIPLAHLAFCSYLQARVGDAWAYYHQQVRLEIHISGWHQLALGRPLQPQHWLGLAFAMLSLAMLGASWSHLRGSERIYALLSLAMPFYHSLWISQPRLMLVIFPLFLGGPPLWRQRSYRIFLALGLLTQVACLALFAAGDQAWIY